MIVGRRTRGRVSPASSRLFFFFAEGFSRGPFPEQACLAPFFLHGGGYSGWISMRVMVFFFLHKMTVGHRAHPVAWWPQCGHGVALCADRWSKSTNLRHSVSWHARLVLLPHPKRRHAHPVPTAPRWRGPNPGGSRP